jgi:hypothetical protein
VPQTPLQLPQMTQLALRKTTGAALVFLLAKMASIIASATEPSLRPPNMGNSIPRGLATK